MVAGIDGCRAGWLCLVTDPASLSIEAHVFTHMAEIARQRSALAAVAIDIPIGLPDAGRRECDVEARRILGRPRSTSVFPAPIRPALAARTRAGASRVTARIDGRKVGAQSWNIYAKVREVDELLGADCGLRALVREVHPEVCFWAWNDRRPMRFSKKTPQGQRERTRLVERHFGRGCVGRVRASLARRLVAQDDILDAFAASWTANRMHAGAAECLPQRVQHDARGLRMEMVF
ncbi:MAG: DUF429 domain-containing protein [Candidatus Krumholzibacteriia bacterium]